MKKIIITLFFAGFFQLSQAQLFFQYLDFNDNNVDSYALSMGGVNTARAFGTGALVNNPAGLAGFKGFGLNVNSNFGFSSGSVISNDDTYSMGNVKDSLVFAPMLSHIGMATGFNIKHINLAFGASYYRAHEWTRKQQVEVVGDGTYDDAYMRAENSAGGINVLSVGGAISSFSQFSLGISYNIVSGHYSESTSFLWHDGDLDSSNEYEISSYEESYDMPTITGSFWEYGVKTTLGGFALGAKFRMPYVLTFNYSTSTEDDNLSKFTLNTPLTADFGANYRINENFAISLGYKIRNWENATVTYNEDVPNQNLTDNNLSSYHVGVDLSGFRAGFYTKKYLANDNSVDPKQLKSFVLTTGFPLVKNDNFSWNVGGSFEFYNNWTVLDESLIVKGVNYKIGTDIYFKF